MGWSPLSPGALRIVVGLLLLSNPFVVAEFDVGDPDWYRYEAAEVGFDEDGIDAPPGVDRIDPDLACVGSFEDRACMLERALHERGGIYYDGLPGSFAPPSYAYVYVHPEGFFDPVGEGRNGSVWYGLRPVPREDVLERVATDLERASEPIRRAVRDGPVETSDELSGANELVATGDGYYVVHAAAYSVTNDVERRQVVVALQWILGGVGLWLVLRGQRVRVERENDGR